MNYGIYKRYVSLILFLNLIIFYPILTDINYNQMVPQDIYLLIFSLIPLVTFISWLVLYYNPSNVIKKSIRIFAWVKVVIFSIATVGFVVYLLYLLQLYYTSQNSGAMMLFSMIFLGAGVLAIPLFSAFAEIYLTRPQNLVIEIKTSQDIDSLKVSDEINKDLLLVKKNIFRVFVFNLIILLFSLLLIFTSTDFQKDLLAIPIIIFTTAIVLYLFSIASLGRQVMFRGILVLFGLLNTIMIFIGWPAAIVFFWAYWKIRKIGMNLNI